MADRTMYDAANMDAIPDGAEIVAGYPYRGGDTVVNFGKFPKALQVWIDQHGNHADTCHAADVENGAISQGTIRQWVESWHLLHPRGLTAVNGFFDTPTVYCSLDNLKTIQGILTGLLYDAWVAAWRTGPTNIQGTSLHQYTDEGGYDISVVYDTTWGVRPAPPKPPPPPPPPVTQHGYLVTASGSGLAGRAVVSGDNGKTWH